MTTTSTIPKASSGKSILKCPICSEPTRSDILIRHLGRMHLAELAASMTPEQRAGMLEKRLPIFLCNTLGSRKAQAFVCGVCKKGGQPLGRNRNLQFEDLQRLHGECSKEFDEYRSYFQSSEPMKVIDPLRPPENVITHVSAPAPAPPPPPTSTLSERTRKQVATLAGEDCPDLDDPDDVVGYLLSAISDLKTRHQNEPEELLEMKRKNEQLESAIEKIAERYADDDTQEALSDFLSDPEWRLVKEITGLTN